ncbi:MAG TPA: AAA family ATPase [Vicinamibacterales bacterium]|nr:AAA family ATPase [Vicinamibacterales bacterium]
MADNPFVYGEIVTAAAFADREIERDRLSRDLLAGQKVFLISPRRYGKSSLVRHVLRGLAKQGVLTVEVTVASSSSYVGFLEAYARALLLADTPAGRLRQWTADLLRSVRPEVRFEAAPTGASRFAIAFPSAQSDRDITRLANEVFALPGRIAAARKRRMAVALDEFQAIGSFNGGSIEHALRAAVQDQRQVGYVFAGSEPSLMERMLTSKRPFYKAGPVMRLEKIHQDDFASFLEGRFAGSGIRPEAGLGTAIVELAGNVPYDVQRLAHELWDDMRAASRKTATLDDLHATLSRLLQEHGPMFEEAWQRLTLAQRATLRALVLEQGREVLSADVRARHRLAGASSVQSSLAGLVKADLVTKDGPRYTMVDSLLREWVARQTY